MSTGTGSGTAGEAAAVHRDALVVDLHVHAPRFVPQPFRMLWHGTNPRRPPDDELTVLGEAGVDLAVVKAVGDPIVTRWYLRRSAWDAVDAQLGMVESQAAAAGVARVRSVNEALSARAAGQPTVMLGVEGADALGDDLDLVDAWRGRGVRVVVLVHLRDNQLGTTCLPWQQYAGPFPVRRRAAPGLSAFGARVVWRMNELGMVVDVAHADTATLRGVIDIAEAPVVSSHSGARAVEDFPRYLGDDELRSVASTGGVIGLWPYRGRRYGTQRLHDLVTHARHIADVVGPEHLAIGTDMNGVPKLAAGYRGERDLPLLTAALLDGGFTAEEVRGIVGGNAVRTLRSVESVAAG